METKNGEHLKKEDPQRHHSKFIFLFFFVLGDLDSTAILWCCFTCGEFVKGSSSEVLYVASEHMCDDLQSSNVIGRFKKSIKVLKTAKAA